MTSNQEFITRREARRMRKWLDRLNKTYTVWRSGQVYTAVFCVGFAALFFGVVIGIILTGQRCG